MIEYEVIILDVDPDEAAKTLNSLAAMGWTVVGTYAGDRVIISREKLALTDHRVVLRKKPVQAINEPPTCSVVGCRIIGKHDHDLGGPAENTDLAELQRCAYQAACASEPPAL